MLEYHSINGQIVPRSEAKLDGADIGFRRGYAAFDYLRIFKGQAVFVEDHLERFARSAEIMRLELPMSQGELTKHVRELVAKNNVEEAGLQLFLTGGAASDGFTPTSSNLVILVNPLPKPPAIAYEQGLKLITYKYQRDLPEVKSTNYMMAVYLSKSMQEAGAADVLYHDGTRVLETTRSNIFLVNDQGKVITADKDILPGITRKQLLKLIPTVAPLELREVSLDELWNAKEVFISSTTKGAMPITQINDHVIGSKAGDITKEIGQAFQKHLDAYLSSVAA